MMRMKDIIDDDLESGYDNLDFDDDFKIIE